MTSKNLRAAAIGLRHGHMGSIGPEKPGWIHTFRHLEGVDVVAYCEDGEPERLDAAREHDPGAGRYDSVDDLIAKEDFDLAFMALPSRDIPPIGIKLADAGKHFLMEKQFARNSTDLAEMVRAVQRNRVKVLAAYPHRYNPVAQDMKRLIDEGVLGKPLDIEVRMITRQVRPGGREPTHFMYTNKDEGGGILHMLGGHYIEVMRFLMGCEIKSVQAMTGRPVGFIDEPLEDVALAGYEFENGAFGSMHAGYLQALQGGYDTSLVYRGELGEANWTPIGGTRLVVKSASDQWSGAPEKTFDYSVADGPPGYASSRWQFQWVQSFIQSIGNGETIIPNELDALHVLQSIDAAYESARSGKRVDVKYGV